VYTLNLRIKKAVTPEKTPGYGFIPLEKIWFYNKLTLATKYSNSVMPDLIRHPVPTWIPAFAGMTILRYLIGRSNNKKSPLL